MVALLGRPSASRMPLFTRLCTGWLVAIVLGAIFADLLPGHQDPHYQGFLFGTSSTNEAPSMAHLLGTDNNSRDIFARIVYGARVSLVVSMTAVVMGTVFGGFLGALVGFVRGKTDATIMATVMAYGVARCRYEMATVTTVNTINAMNTVR